MKNKVMLSLVVLSIIFLISCGNKDTGTEDKFVASGTDGIVLKFVENTPQSKIIVGSPSRDIRVVAEVSNAGAWHNTEGDDKTKLPLDGAVYLSGFNTDIYPFHEGATFSQDDYIETMGDGKFLVGRNNLNPKGGYQIFDYEGKILHSGLPPGKDTPSFLLTACYRYHTIASTPVCVNRDPFNERIQRVCESGTASLGSQGAPIAVTRVEQEPLKDKIHFTVHIKNVGKGDVFDVDPTFCNPYEIVPEKIIKRKHIELVKLERFDLNGVNKKAECKPLTAGADATETEYIRLIDGETLLLCTVGITDVLEGQPASFTTPLEIELSYTYRNSIQKKIEVTKLDE